MQKSCYWKLLCLALLLPATAHGSLLAEVMAGNYTGITCDHTYTAPPGTLFIDLVCTSNYPRYSSAEVTVQSPLIVDLLAIGGGTAVGCNPTDGCPSSEAQIQYSDIWTVTGATGPGTLVLVPNYQLSEFTEETVQGHADPGSVLIPFVFGQPFTFSFNMLVGNSDIGYTQIQLHADLTPEFYEGTCSDIPQCFHQNVSVAGTLTSADFGTLIVGTPEPGTLRLTGFVLAGLGLLALRKSVTLSLGTAGNRNRLG